MNIDFNFEKNNIDALLDHLGFKRLINILWLDSSWIILWLSTIGIIQFQSKQDIIMVILKLKPIFIILVKGTNECDSSMLRSDKSFR
jgi:hypothetical protein